MRFSLRIQIRHGRSVKIVISSALMRSDVGFYSEIVLPCAVVIQVILKQIEEYGNMRRIAAPVELVAGQFINNYRLVIDVIVVIQAGIADIADQEHVLTVMSRKGRIKQRRCRALPLCSCNADSLPAELRKKKLRLGSHLLILDRSIDSRALNYQVVVIENDILAFALEYLDFRRRTMALKESLG